MKAIFLDRDGVINQYPGDFKYVTSWEDFRFLPGAAPALKLLRKNGYRIFVISNQAGVSKGVYSREALDAITVKMSEELQKEGALLDGVYYCTHRPEEDCLCRKPKPGMVKEAIGQLKAQGEELDREASFFIGDSIPDIETGRAAGLKTILVFSGREKPENNLNWQTQPDFTAADLLRAVDIILGK